MRFFLAFLALAIGLVRAETSVKDSAWVEQRVAALEPTKGERRLDEIGWAPSLTEAQNLSRASGRPVFLFTHDGRMGTGRC